MYREIETLIGMIATYFLWRAMIGINTYLYMYACMFVVLFTGLILYLGYDDND